MCATLTIPLTNVREQPTTIRPWWMDVKLNVLPIFINSGSYRRDPAEGLGAGEPLTESELAEFVAQTMPKLHSWIQEANLLEPVVIGESWEDIYRIRDESRGDLDVILPITAGNVYNRGWRHSTPVEVRLDVIGKPILRIQNMVWDFLGLEAVAALKAYGAEAYFAPTPKKANELLRPLRMKKLLEQTKIAAFGYVESRSVMVLDGIPTNIADPATLKQLTGVELTYFDWHVLGDIANSLPVGEVRALAQEWREGATDVSDLHRSGETSLEWMEAQVRLYLAYRHMMDERGFTAFSGCVTPDDVFGASCPPCYTFVRLKEEGVPAGCECDQNSLLSLMLLMYLSGKPGDMGNTLIPSYLDDYTTTDDHMEDWQIPTPGENVIAVSHSVTPTNMRGFDQPRHSYCVVGTHCDTCYGINTYVELDEGQEVTVARLGPKGEKMLIAEGTIDSTHMTVVQGNRNAVYIKVNDREEFIQKQTEVGNHLSFVYGHVGQDLANVCEYLGIEPLWA